MPGSDDLERVWRQKLLDELMAGVDQLSTGVVVEFAVPQHVIVDSGGGSGALTDAQLRASPVPVSVAGVATAANQATEIGGLAAIFARQADGTQHTIVDGSVAVTGMFWQATQPVSGPLTDAQLRAVPVPVSGTVTVNLGLTDVQLRATAVPVSAAALPLPTGASTEATLALIKAKTDNLDVALSTRAVTGLTDTQLRAAAVPVSIAATVTTKETRSATGTQTSVAGSAVSVTLLASNASRLGASFYNDSSAILYLRCQAAASTANFTVKLFAEDFYELPFGYTGIVDGIWALAVGNCRVTEHT